MANNPITTPLPADLPTDWVYGQTVSPDGTDVGQTQQHGYNYLMQQVNAAQNAVSQVGTAFPQLYGQGDVVPVSGGGTGQTSLSAVTVGAASRLSAARTIALSGGATATATGFDGSANITIPVTGLDMSKANAGTLPVARGGTGVTSLETLGASLKVYPMYSSSVSSVDMNGYAANGIYNIQMPAGTNQTPFHTPLGETTSGYSAVTWYVLVVFGQGSYRVTQLCTSVYTTNYGFWWRTKHDNTWTPWKEVVDSENISSMTAGNANKWGGYTIWKGTQAQYDALSSKSSSTLYFIVG